MKLYYLHIKTSHHYTTVKVTPQKAEHYSTFICPSVSTSWQPHVALNDDVTVEYKSKDPKSVRLIRQFWQSKAVGPDIHCWLTSTSSKNDEEQESIVLDFGKQVIKSLCRRQSGARKLRAKANRVQVGNCCQGGEVHFIYKSGKVILEAVYVF